MRIMGYNLGSSRDDIVAFSIRGVACSTMRRESSNSLVCVSGDPAITADSGAVRDYMAYDFLFCPPLLRLSELTVQRSSRNYVVFVYRCVLECRSAWIHLPAA